MARRRSISIVTTTCKRCGKQIATGSRSLYGCDSLKAKWDRICSDCMTKEEEREMLIEQGQAISKNMRTRL